MSPKLVLPPKKNSSMPPLLRKELWLPICLIYGTFDQRLSETSDCKRWFGVTETYQYTNDRFVPYKCYFYTIKLVKAT